MNNSNSFDLVNNELFDFDINDPMFDFDIDDPMFDFMDQAGDVGPGISESLLPGLYTSPCMQHLLSPSPENAPALNAGNTNIHLGDSVTSDPVSASPSISVLNASNNDSPTNPHVLSDRFTSFQPTIHASQNPLFPTQSVRPRAAKRTLDPAQSYTMNEAKAAKQQKAMLLKQDLILLLEDYEAKIEALSEKHSTKVKYIKHLATTVSGLKNKRAPGRMQVLLHIKAQEVNGVLPVGQKLKVPALRKLVEDDEELLELSGEKLEQAKREVNEKRMLSTCGTRPNIISVVKDYSATTQRIKKEFDFLHLRTGAVGFGILAPGSSDDRGRPTWFVSGDSSVEFVRKHLNMTMWDLLGQFELWASARQSERPGTIIELQTWCSDIIASGLRHILSNKTSKMNYVNYHQKIVAKSHVRLIGLPQLPVFMDAKGPVQPFTIKDLPTLEALHTVLQCGTCHWVRMSQDDIAEHSEWLKTQVPKERAVRSDKGQKRGSRKQTASNGEHDARSSKRKRTDTHPILASRRQCTLKTTRIGQAVGSRKSRVLKQLPPQQRSHPLVQESDEDEDSDGQGSGSGSDEN
ncbi:hypothetical protein DFH05DRAFT_1522492 [Lentinula detonsa]|uniref:Uncharacterized protein n=1 Tax=Lentinula detonsa TaxID=2804962 RepID=A0A9W8P729_9AGAR|nr:hypothetical protein DFH05DRAFT_1522492 [Lentinula detonsa]